MSSRIKLLCNRYLKRLSGPKVWDFLIEATYLLAVFSVPVWFAYWLPTYNIFAFNKLSLLKLFTIVLAFLTVIKLIFYPPRLAMSLKGFFKRYWFVPTIFILGLSFSLFFSSDPSLSFYGAMARQGGLISYIFYFLWFVLLSFNLLTLGTGRTSRRGMHGRLLRLLSAFSLSGLLVSVYAVLQILDIDFLTWPEPPYLTHRALSTFGQPNFLASWLLLVIPIGFYLAWYSRHAAERVIFSVIGLLELVALFLTGSRGALLGLVIVGAFFVIYKMFKTRWSKKVKILALLACLVFFGVASVGFNLYSGGRLSRLLHDDSGSASIRLDFYKASFQSIIKKPLWGNGLENSGQIFIRYYRPDWGVYGNVAQNTDRAHNIVLDILLETGLGGLMLFVGFYYFFFYLSYRNSHNEHSRPLSTFMALGVSAYLASMLFSFSTVGSELYIWSFLAIAISLKASRDMAESKTYTNFGKILFRSEMFSGFISWLLKISLFLALLILALSCSAVIFRSVSADYYFNGAISSLNDNNYENFLKFDRSLLQTRPNSIALQSYDRQIVQILFQSSQSWESSQYGGLIKSRLSDAYKFLPKKGYNNLLAKSEAGILLGDLSASNAYLEKLAKISPFWPPVWMVSGDLALKQGNLQKALIDYHLAQLNTPSPSDSRLNKDHRANVSYYQYLISLRIANAYNDAHNYGAALKYYSLAYKYYPSAYNLLQNIALDYYQLGDFTSARHYAQHGLIRDPGGKSALSIFKLIRQSK